VTTTPSDYTTAGTGTFRILDGMLPTELPNATQKQDVEMAVHAHFQALRSLGRTRVSAAEVASALNLSEAVVLAAAHSLTAKGVKLLG
jgi:hypothetical protein